MRFTFLCCVLASTLCLPGLTQQASLKAGPSSSETSPVGRWRTIDDATGKVKSLVIVWEEHDTLYGKIERILDRSSTDSDPRCGHCQGELKNTALVGLRILWDLRKDGAQWSGGKVIDPESGKIYKCSIAVEDGGRKLKVRGFIGFSILGRTQYWLREESQ